MSRTALTGRVDHWTPERGFGFIRTADGTRYFFHVRDWRAPATPEAGLPVLFEPIQVGGKGPRAMAVRPQAVARASAAPAPGRQPPPPRSPAQRQARAARPDAARPTPVLGPQMLIVTWAGLLVWALWQQRLPVGLVLALPLLNGATFFAYWLDKDAARKGRWRTQEQVLHLLALLGGWPAAWWAQQLLRHKSVKQPFRSVYWLTVGLNLAVVALVALPALPGALLQALGRG